MDDGKRDADGEDGDDVPGGACHGRDGGGDGPDHEDGNDPTTRTGPTHPTFARTIRRETGAGSTCPRYARP